MADEIPSHSPAARENGMAHHSESLLFNLVVCLAAALLCGGLAE
jgi:hypothetical protein